MVRFWRPTWVGQAELPADTNGDGFIRLDGQYLTQALIACGGMVDFSLANASSPMLFTVNGYQMVVMPMITDKASEQAKAQKAEAKAKAEAEPKEAKPSRAKVPAKA